MAIADGKLAHRDRDFTFPGMPGTPKSIRLLDSTFTQSAPIGPAGG